MRTFELARDHHFPGAVLASDYVAASVRALTDHGFTWANCIACVGLCRDEITRPLSDEIQNVWGEAFNFSSLGGVLLLGKTGLLAAHHHAPEQDQVERYTYYVMPHIAISATGGIGECLRTGRSALSSACGALSAFQKEVATGRVDLQTDPDNLEYSLLKQKVHPNLPSEHTPDLVELTKITATTILEGLEHLINVTPNDVPHDYAVFSGIQIHGPAHTNWIWPTTSYVVRQGTRYDNLLDP